MVVGLPKVEVPLFPILAGPRFVNMFVQRANLPQLPLHNLVAQITLETFSLALSRSLWDHKIWKSAQAKSSQTSKGLLWYFWDETWEGQIPGSIYFLVRKLGAQLEESEGGSRERNSKAIGRCWLLKKKTWWIWRKSPRSRNYPWNEN